MSDAVETQGSEEPKDVKDSGSTGNTNLLIGAGFGAYGTTLAVTVGYVCPMCLIITPIFLGMGGVQKYKYLKKKAEEKSV